MLLLAGCAAGPNFHRPAIPPGSYTSEPLPKQTSASAVTGGEAQRFVEGSDIPAQWWTLFHSEALNALITRSLQANADLRAAQAALRAARANALAQAGVYYPSVQGTGAANRNKTAASLSPTPASGELYYALYTGQVSVSYVPDVFGLNRRTVESAKAQAEAQQFQVEATYLTLTANVVTAVVQEASLRGQISATEEMIGSQSEQLQIMRRQQDLGAISGADVLAQEAALAQAQQALPPLQKQLAQQRDLLAVLCGGMPSQAPTEPFELASLTLPQDLPVSLPARLVEQRPDVRMAEANLHAASAQVGVAVANRLPNLTITAFAGSAALATNELFASGSGIWTVGGNLLQPVFSGGSLLQKQRAAEATFEQAAAQYRSTVLSAFQNVADTLHALQADADAVKAASVAEHAAAQSLDIARKQFRLGAVAYLALLNAEQTYQQARLSLVQAQAARFADTAALFQALGGGWWNRR
jgi:NodT family efflux transporter outer membrane factor (OMF) lipoprotein